MGVKRAVRQGRAGLWKPPGQITRKQLTESASPAQPGHKCNQLLLRFLFPTHIFQSTWMRNRFVSSKMSLPQGCHVQLSRWFTAHGMRNVKMCCPEPSSRKAQLSSCRESGQQSVSSCQLLQSLPLLQEAALPEVTPFLGQPKSGD